MASARDIVTPKAPMSACYLLARHDIFYFGETNNFYRRFYKHLLDPTKAFAREMFVISGLGDDFVR